MNVKILASEFIEKEKELKKDYLSKLVKIIQSLMFNSSEITEVSFVFLRTENENYDFEYEIKDFKSDANEEDLIYEEEIKRVLDDSIPLLVELLKTTTYFKIKQLGELVLIKNYVYK